MSQHYVIIPLRPWGHSRPEITFGLRLLKLHPHLVITIFLSASTREKTRVLISDFGLEPTESDRLRVVPYGFLKPPPANPIAGKEDDEATWKLSLWTAENVIPPLKKYLKVRLGRKLDV